MDPLLRELIAGIPGALLQDEALLDTVGTRLLILILTLYPQSFWDF